MTQQSFGVPTERFQIASEDRFVPAFIRVTSSASVTTAYCSVRPVQLRNPDHHLRTVPTTAEGTPVSGSMNTALFDF